MKLYRRALASMLAAALVLLCAGCTRTQPGAIHQALDTAQQHAASHAPSAPETKPAVQPQITVPVPPAPDAPPAPATDGDPEPMVSGGYFTRLPRTETAFRDMELSGWTEEAFDALLDEAEDAARSGSKAGFHSACWRIRNAIVDIYTDYTLLDIRNSQNSGDEQTAAAVNDQYLLYNTVYDAFAARFHALSKDGGCLELMNREFDDFDILWFSGYDPESADSELELSMQEQDLVLQYEAEMAKSRPSAETLGEIYVSLVEVRKQIAAQSGSGYAEYAYKNDYSRDYTPADAQAIWQLAKEQFVPLQEQYARALAKADDTLWYRGGLDLSPEAITGALAYGAARMSPEIRESCRYLLENGLYDIADSPTKLEVGYTTWIASYQAPFIFDCPYGGYYDYQTMFHEFGHFTSFYYNGSDVLGGVSDYDLSELQSQGMEVMFLPMYEGIFGEKNARLMRALTVGNLISSVISGAMYDEFQQRVFEEEDLTPARVNEIFREVSRSYGVTGSDTQWMQVVHNYEEPMYYISYAVSALPALELFALQQQSPADALDVYLRGAAMSDEEYYLSEALEEMGLTNQMKSPDTSIADAVRASGVLDVG